MNKKNLIYNAYKYEVYKFGPIPLLSTPIKCVELSTRTINLLICADIIFVSDLLESNPLKLLKEPNFGRKSLVEVEQFMSKNNLEFNDWANFKIDRLRKLKQDLDKADKQNAYIDLGQIDQRCVLIDGVVTAEQIKILNDYFKSQNPQRIVYSEQPAPLSTHYPLILTPKE